MRTPSCHYLPPNRHPRRSHSQLLKLRHGLEARLERAPRGQVLVIFAVALLALLAFVGLVVDAGSVYVSYGQLKRAVDTAAVAAANEFKRGATTTLMTNSAAEVLQMQNVDMSTVNLKVFICSDAAAHLSDAPLFFAKCPDTAHGEVPKKLVYIDAKQKAPLYFLSLIGVNAVNLETNAIAEAASINLVIVLDISGSMDTELNTDGTSRSPGFVQGHYYDPNAAGNCNVTLNTATALNGTYQAIRCYPMRDALDAAAALVDTMYATYDTVGLVTFAKDGNIVPIGGASMSGNIAAAEQAIYSVKVSQNMDDTKLWGPWQQLGATNPVNFEDLSGDNQIKGLPTNLPSSDGTCGVGGAAPANRWDTTHGGPAAWGGGVPCNDNRRLDAFDWNGNGIFDDSDELASEAWLKNYVQVNRGITLPAPAANNLATLTAYWPYLRYMSSNDTCSGCGVRVASNLIKSTGNANSVWVMVFLSDGVANLTDTENSPGLPAGYFSFSLPAGFCGGNIGVNNRLWGWLCINFTPNNPRYCIQTDHGQTGHVNRCALTGPLVGGTWATYADMSLAADKGKYTPEDYARDMIDQAALTHSNNTNEPSGNDIAVYTIGLGKAVGHTTVSGAGTMYPEGLLRYMAAVGDDGDRNTDPCAGVAEKLKCGSYYYAAKGNALRPIFDDIASRIYTRITQ